MHFLLYKGKVLPAECIHDPPPTDPSPTTGTAFLHEPVTHSLSCSTNWQKALLSFLRIFFPFGVLMVVFAFRDEENEA